MSTRHARPFSLFRRAMRSPRGRVGGWVVAFGLAVTVILVWIG